MNLFQQIKNRLVHPEGDHQDETSLSLAKAVILIEIARYDEDFTTSEKQCIKELLRKEFELSPVEIDDLLQEAARYRQDQVDVFYSTRRLNELLSVEEKKDFMVQVWKVVLADGRIDYSEDVLTRKLIHLLRLERLDWVQTRDRAKQELGEKKRDINQ